MKMLMEDVRKYFTPILYFDVSVIHLNINESCYSCVSHTRVISLAFASFPQQTSWLLGKHLQHLLEAG
jgi:hypothetical protein